MNTKQLRQKILDLAIKGKLVPQDPNDEPASKLLERIRAEKEQLIKDKKIKRDKNESYIFVGDDKLHYEKFADGSVVCIENEIPFEIPENWAWCRLKNAGTAKIGLTYKPTDVCNFGIPVLRSNNIKEDKLNLNELIYVNCNVNDNLLVKDNDILICARNGSKHLVGKSALIKKNENKMTFGAFMSIYRSCCNDYVFRFLNSNYFRTTMADANSTQINQLTQDMIKETLCPLPPLSEQKRISKTIKNLLDIVDTIEADKIDLTELFKQTKLKVLDLAIRGKLVPQDPNDEPADKLLEKIREEKEKLIKEGKLKRDKNETFIYKNSDDNSYYEQIEGETICIDDDLPFEIPDSWRWCKMQNCVDVRDGTHDTPKYVENGIPLITSKNISSGYLDFSNVQCISKDDHMAISIRSKVDKGDILFAMIGSIGNPVIVNTDKEFSIKNVALFKNFTKQQMCMQYLYCYLSSIQKQLRTNAKGGNQPFIPLAELRTILLPISPFKEQQKIASKIENIFSYLDNLELILKGS